MDSGYSTSYISSYFPPFAYVLQPPKNAREINETKCPSSNTCRLYKMKYNTLLLFHFPVISRFMYTLVSRQVIKFTHAAPNIAISRRKSQSPRGDRLPVELKNQSFARFVARRKETYRNARGQGCQADKGAVAAVRGWV